MFDANAFSQHWVDVLVTALLACLGYLGADRLASLEKEIDECKRDIRECRDKILTFEGRRGGDGRIIAE